MVSINHAEIVATSDLYLNGKPELEQAESGGKHTCDLKWKQGSLKAGEGNLKGMGETISEVL